MAVETRTSGISLLMGIPSGRRARRSALRRGVTILWRPKGSVRFQYAAIVATRQVGNGKVFNTLLVHMWGYRGQ